MLFKLVMATYLVLSLAYLTVGFLLLRESKKKYPDFYQSSKCKVLAATLILSGTMLSRFIMSLLREVTDINKEIEESEEKDTYFAPLFDTILFVTSDSTPVIAQLLTLVFGLIRAENHRNTLQNINPNTGYLANKSDSLLSRTSVNTQFFDPPIENYLSNT